MMGIDVLDYRIYLKRSGFVYIPRKDNRILSKSEMNELKKLVKELKNSNTSGKYDYYEDGLFIDGKKYNKNQENEYTYSRIVKILKKYTWIITNNKLSKYRKQKWRFDNYEINR